MRHASWFGLAVVALLVGSGGVTAQGTADISIPLPIHINDMGLMRTVKVQVTTPTGHPLFDMVSAAAHGGSVPSEPWTLIPWKSAGVYEGYVNMPMGNTFYVIGRVEWENPSMPGMPCFPSDIDYPTRGGFPAGFLKTATFLKTAAEARAYTKDVLEKASSAKIDAEVKNKKFVDIEFHQNFGSKAKQVRVGLLNTEDVGNPADTLTVVDPNMKPYTHFKEVGANGRYWAHGWVRFGDLDGEQLFIRKGPINIKID